MTDQTSTEAPISEVAVLLAHVAKQHRADPRHCYVALMTAAAIAGHIIDQTPEQMAETLAKVEGAAHAKILGITETKQ